MGRGTRPCVVGRPVSQDGPTAPRSVRVTCGRCGQPMWLSPALLDHVGDRVCGDCCDPATTDADLCVSEASLLELATAWGVTPDEAFHLASAHCLTEFGRPLRRDGEG